MSKLRDLGGQNYRNTFLCILLLVCPSYHEVSTPGLIQPKYYALPSIPGFVETLLFCVFEKDMYWNLLIHYSDDQYQAILF